MRLAFLSGLLLVLTSGQCVAAMTEGTAEALENYAPVDAVTESNLEKVSVVEEPETQIVEAPKATTVASRKNDIATIYNRALVLEQLILALRDANSLSHDAKKPPVQTAKLFEHVYAKYLEVEAKIGRLQNQFGMDLVKAPAYGFASVTPEKLHGAVDLMVSSMEQILDNEMVDLPDAPARVTGKTNSNTYEKLWQISYQLDDLLGPANSTRIFAQLSSAIGDLSLIGRAMNIDSTFETPALKPTTATDSNLEGFRNLYRLAKLERLLDMNAVRVSDFPVGQITPAETFDTVNNMMVELARIKAHLNVTETAHVGEVSETVSPSQVLQAMEKFGALASTLISALESKNGKA